MHPEWFWEGNVQAALGRHLEGQGWKLVSEADTAARSPGIDLVAQKDGRRLGVEVKGYPSTTYARGEKRGQPKPTQPTNQARHWYSHALLAVMLMRDKEPGAEIALAFPAFPTFTNLVKRTKASLELLGVGIYFVFEDGRVVRPLDHRPPGTGE